MFIIRNNSKLIISNEMDSEAIISIRKVYNSIRLIQLAVARPCQTSEKI